MPTDEFDDHDAAYWERYYRAHREPGDPSRFARHVAERHLTPGARLLELGCGNGRDAVYLAGRGAHVVAVDRCEPEVAFLAERHGSDTLGFVCADFTRLTGAEGVVALRCFDVIYARFTLHSVARVGQQRVVDGLTDLLDPGGSRLVAFEFRGLRNELLGVGDPVGEDGDTYVHDGHTRRFIDADALADELRSRGFSIVEASEQRGFSPFGDTDETFARIIARLDHP